MKHFTRIEVGLKHAKPSVNKRSIFLSQDPFNWVHKVHNSKFYALQEYRSRCYFSSMGQEIFTCNWVACMKMVTIQNFSAMLMRQKTHKKVPVFKLN